MFLIYKLKAPNGKLYFNYTKDLKKRFNYGCGFHENKPLNADIRRYGWQTFEITTIDDVDDEATAKQIVANLVADSGSDSPGIGYNKPINSRPSTEAQIVARGLRKPVLQLSLDDTPLVQYKSLNAAASAIGGSPTSLSNCLHGRLKSYKGFHWRYASID